MKGLTLKISDRFKNRKIDFFNNFSLNLAHDTAASAFNFNFYFDPENIEHKEFACITHYHIVELFYFDELVVTGNIINNKFRVSSVKELSGVNGYSLPGVLGDCEIPIELYPLQTDGLSLREIAQRLIKPFGIKMIVDPAVSSKMDKSFDTSTASESQTVISYLVELASQKDIIISHDEKGNLLFTEAKTDKAPIIDFDLSKAVPVGTSFDFEVDGQSMHSKITVQKQASVDGGNAGSQTIRNPYVLQSVHRPTVKSQSSGDDNDTSLAANRALSNELRAVKLTITTDRWVIDGKVIRPNNTITIIAPHLYIFKKTKFFIESVSLTGDNVKTTAVLNCVLPEVYNGKVPESIFKGINLHAI
jgi:prophage tail gpP-like protein